MPASTNCDIKDVNSTKVLLNATAAIYTVIIPPCKVMSLDKATAAGAT